MDLEIIILSEVISQTEKDKYDIISLICGNLKKKKDTNELINKPETRLTDLENEFMVTKGERGRKR